MRKHLAQFRGSPRDRLSPSASDPLDNHENRPKFAIVILARYKQSRRTPVIFLVRLDVLSPSLTALLHDILNSRVYDVARETPLDQAPGLSRRLGNTVLFKREDLQPVFSFKLRGAYNKISHLTAEERARGIITASAGNHSQGVAFSARKLGLRAVIVMPQTTPRIKVDAVRGMGPEVVLSGDSYGDAKAHCDTLAAETGMTFIPPFDDPLVIAGQGTIGAEILRHSQERLSAVFVPVGGGGLIAGIAGYIKALRPDVKVIGVEPFEADAMYRSLEKGSVCASITSASLPTASPFGR